MKAHACMFVREPVKLLRLISYTQIQSHDATVQTDCIIPEVEDTDRLVKRPVVAGCISRLMYRG